jgi:hypothetical protein
MQRGLLLSAKLLVGSGCLGQVKASAFTVPKSHMANDAAREMQARLKLHVAGACCSCMLLIRNGIAAGQKPGAGQCER